MKIEKETRPCTVVFGGIKREGTFHGIYQFSKTHGASAMIGGFSAGTNAHPVAVVEINGDLMEVRVNQVQFTDVVRGDKSELEELEK